MYIMQLMLTFLIGCLQPMAPAWIRHCNLTTKDKIIHLQRPIHDVTRRKIHVFASLQEQLLQSCFDQSMKVFDETLKEVKIRKQWALFLYKFTNSFLSTNNLRTALYLFVLFAVTFKAIEEICRRFEFSLVVSLRLRLVGKCCGG